MKNPSKVLLATAALITIHSTPGWSEPILQATQSGTQGEISRLEKNIKKNYRDIKSLNDLGIVHLKLGQYDEAIIQFKKALEIDPLYTVGPVFFGNIYTDAENYQDKIKEFQAVIKTNREYARAHNYLGLAYLQQKNYLTAKYFLLESIKINPKRHITISVFSMKRWVKRLKPLRVTRWHKRSIPPIRTVSLTSDLLMTA